jgi:hypothetical protein
MWNIKILSFASAFFLSCVSIALAQAPAPAKDKGKFNEVKPGFYQNEILKSI